MGLIDQEQDGRAVLEAEDAVIRDADAPEDQPPIPTGGELARLIASLTDETAAPQDRQG